MVGVDPRVHARGGLQLRPRRPQLGRNHRRAALQLFDEYAHANFLRSPSTSYTNVSVPADRAALERLHALPRLPHPRSRQHLIEELSACGGSYRSCSSASAADPATARQARRRDPVRVRGQQDPQAPDRRGAGARRWRRHADHDRRRCSRTTRARPRRWRRGWGSAACWSPTARRRTSRPRTPCWIDCSARTSVTSRPARRARRRWSRPPRSCARRGRTPFVIPLGASTPHGAAAYALAVGGAADADPAARSHRPRRPRRAARRRESSPAARCADLSHAGRWASAPTIRRPRSPARSGASWAASRSCSARRPARWRARRSRSTTRSSAAATACRRRQSIEAIELCARREALFLDPTYTAKAMAGLIARHPRARARTGTVLFWHTGGQVGLFA